MDPWLINPMYAKCGEVDFAAGVGMDSLSSNVDALLTKIRRKYKEYGINEKPFVIVKADNGNCGMGIMTVRDVKDLDLQNIKAQEGLTLTEVIVQEGVLTNERVNDAVAEPVVYMIDSSRLPQPGRKPGSSSPNRFYMYGVIARLAMLAASYELEGTDPLAEVYD
jgi:glutamate--cysteine ligase